MTKPKKRSPPPRDASSSPTSSSTRPGNSAARSRRRSRPTPPTRVIGRLRQLDGRVANFQRQRTAERTREAPAAPAGSLEAASRRRDALADDVQPGQRRSPADGEPSAWPRRASKRPYRKVARRDLFGRRARRHLRRQSRQTRAGDGSHPVPGRHRRKRTCSWRRSAPPATWSTAKPATTPTRRM